MPLYVKSVVDKIAMEQDFLRVLLFFPVSIIATTFHTHLHQHVDLTRRSSWRRVDTVQNAVLFRKLWRIELRSPCSSSTPPHPPDESFSFAHFFRHDL
jgi:hypothetical protein